MSIETDNNLRRQKLRDRLANRLCDGTHFGGNDIRGIVDLVLRELERDLGLQATPQSDFSVFHPRDKIAACPVAFRRVIESGLFEIIPEDKGIRLAAKAGKGAAAQACLNAWVEELAAFAQFNMQLVDELIGLKPKSPAGYPPLPPVATPAAEPVSPVAQRLQEEDAKALEKIQEPSPISPLADLCADIQKIIDNHIPDKTLRRNLGKVVRDKFTACRALLQPEIPPTD